MTLRVVERARQTWAGLASHDFDAVDDLVAAFTEDPTEQAWRHVDVVKRVETGGYDVAVVPSRRVLDMIERAADPLQHRRPSRRELTDTRPSSTSLVPGFPAQQGKSGCPTANRG